MLTIVPQNFADLIYIIGETGNEMGGSEFAKIIGLDNNNVPSVNEKKAKENYNNFTKANQNKFINSAISVGVGGLAVTLSKMAIASNKGLEINCNNINSTNKKIENSCILFSESPSRIIVTVSKRNRNKFESFFKKNQFSLLGKITNSKKIIIMMKEKKKFEVSINSLCDKYKQDLFN